MLNNQKGISGIVATIITIGIVLVGVAIVWSVVSGVFDTQVEKVNYAEKCLGIIISPTSVDCDGEVCSVKVERGLASSQDIVDGVEITLDDGESTLTEQTGNIVTSETIEFTTDMEAPDAIVRLYFVDEAGEAVYCTQTSTYP